MSCCCCAVVLFAVLRCYSHHQCPCFSNIDVDNAIAVAAICTRDAAAVVDVASTVVISVVAVGVNVMMLPWSVFCCCIKCCLCLYSHIHCCCH